MAERTKYLVPVEKWAKWTGDNLAELEATSPVRWIIGAVPVPRIIRLTPRC